MSCGKCTILPKWKGTHHVFCFRVKSADVTDLVDCKMFSTCIHTYIHFFWRILSKETLPILNFFSQKIEGCVRTGRNLVAVTGTESTPSLILVQNWVCKMNSFKEVVLSRLAHAQLLLHAFSEVYKNFIHSCKHKKLFSYKIYKNNN